MLNWLISPLLSMIGYDYRNKRAKDKELLQKFLEILPSDSDSIRFLKDHDMGDTARFSYFQPLNIINEDWLAADKEFQVSKIEKKKVEFIEKLGEFLDLYATRSSGGLGGTISVGPRHSEWDSEMHEYVARLNQLSTEAYQKYEEFVRIASKEI